MRGGVVVRQKMSCILGPVKAIDVLDCRANRGSVMCREVVVNRANGRPVVEFVGLLLIGFVLVFLSGCAHYYQPTDSYPVEPIRDFSSTGAVALVNGQPSKERVFFYGKLYGDLNAWTDVAMAMAERELRNRGIGNIKETSKSISMSIDSTKTDVGFVMITSTIVMSVKTSDGYSATYTGRDRSGVFGRPKKQMDKAMMRVVVAMLNDPHVISFLVE